MENGLLLTTIISVVIIIVVPVIINFSRKIHRGNRVKGDKSLQVNGDNNTTTVTNIGTQNYYNSERGTTINRSSETSLVDEIKARIRILFVDDKDDFPIVEMLKNNGYSVDYLRDIVDIDASVVRFADIIFLDINGVGVAMKFKNQGMGLCGALRDHFGDTKRLILYSGETEGSIFDKDAKKADATLPKDSDLYQFTSYITQYGKELLEKAN